jgi:hypothetical protein
MVRKRANLCNPELLWSWSLSPLSTAQLAFNPTMHTAAFPDLNIGCDHHLPGTLLLEKVVRKD